MDKLTIEILHEMREDIKEIKKEVNELKRFKNRVLGGLAVFVFVLQSALSYLFK